MTAGSERVIAFIERLTHTSGPAAGRPFRLRDWQKTILRQIFDPTREDGTRRVRTALASLPRKQGKTELAAALSLYFLMGDDEQGGQVYSAAADRSQASLVFNAAAQMVRNDPELHDKVRIIDSQKRIVHYPSGSFYAAISSESRTKHGFSASAIIYDELAQAPNRDLFDVLTTSTGARVQPLTLIISTAGHDKQSIMRELYEYGCKVRDGVIVDDTFVPIIYEAPEDADWLDEEVWYACNPALGDFRSLDEMRTMADRARQIPALESVFRNLYLNQWIDVESRWLSSEVWNAGAREIGDLSGRACCGGLDLSSTTDLTSLVLAFPGPEGYTVLPHFWAAEEGLEERVRRDRVPYDVWARQGLLTLTPGGSIDKMWVCSRIARLINRYKLTSIAFDAWRAEDLKTLLHREGIDLPLEPFAQNFKNMGPAVDAVEGLVLDHKLIHGGHPILTWNCANCVIEFDSTGNRKLSKRKSTGRIDGMVALAMAIAQHQKAPVVQESVYNTRGIIGL